MAIALARSGDLASAESSLAEARHVRRMLGGLEDDATSLVSEVNIRHWRASARESIAAVNGAVAIARRTGYRYGPRSPHQASRIQRSASNVAKRCENKGSRLLPGMGLRGPPVPHESQRHR